MTVIQDFDPKVPIYIQIAEIIKKKILKGELKMGERIPSVREMARITKTNPLTVQKAYNYLQMEGFIEVKRGRGFYVIEDEKFLEKQKELVLKELIEYIKKQAQEYGLDLRRIKEALGNAGDKDRKT